MATANWNCARALSQGNTLRVLVLRITADHVGDVPEDALTSLDRSFEVVTCMSLERAREELARRTFDVLVWWTGRRSNILRTLHRLRDDKAAGAIIVVAVTRGRGGEVEQCLETAMQDGQISDYLFEDEVPILCRSVRRIGLEGRRTAEKHAVVPALGTASLWAALTDTLPSAVYALNKEGEVLFWNTAAERTFGWTAAEVAGKPLPTVPAGSQQEFRVLLESQMLGIPHRGIEVVRKTKAGKLIPLSLWTGPLRDSQGRIEGKLAVLLEMSQAHQAQRERAELIASEREARSQARSVERFRELVEAAPDAIMEVDADGTILLMNATTERMFGYSRGELVGKPVEVLVPAEHRHHHIQHRANYQQHRVRRPMGTDLHLYGQRKDGSRFPVEISLSPVNSPDGFRVSAVIRDVTDRQRAEDQFRELQSRLTTELSSANRELEIRSVEAERANRLKSEFLTSISHELRTPLHTIIGFSELLAEKLEGPLNEKQARFVNHIRNDSFHLLELINGILDLSKIEAGKLDLHLEVFDAAAAMEEAVSSVAPVADTKQITMTVVTCPRLMVRADPVRFKQILLNLLGNAVKFTPEHGTVQTECETCDDFARFCVSDTGLGIPHEEQEAIFDKFHQAGSTTNGVREGTGLGLAITRHLVESHGGRIWVESAPGCGSRFFFTVPLR